MAITLIKTPATFFNCTNPAIFEFTTDAVVGNFDDYVVDVFINSEYDSKSAVVRNVFPNTKNKIFWVDLSGFFLALQEKNFRYNFDGSKNLSIEKFNIDLRVRDGSQPNSEIQSFDSYSFDNLIFTDGLDSIDSENVSFFSILGSRNKFDNFDHKLLEDKLTFLAADNIEVCDLFPNYISIWNNEMNLQTVTVGGVVGNIPFQKGVSTYLLSSNQIAKINSLTKITCSNQNNSKQLFAFPFKYSQCDQVVQFRYYNSKGGFSYFHSVLESEKSDRSKVTFYDNNFYNENEYKNDKVQSSVDFGKTFTFKGSKLIQLKETFNDLLRSPKVEMNLKMINGNDKFIECEVIGSSVDVYLSFDFNLTAKI